MTDQPKTLQTIGDVLRGEYTAVTPLNLVETLRAASRHQNNALALAHRAMVQDLARVAVPFIPVEPEAEDFEAVADYIIKTAEIADRWLLAVGEEVKSNSMEGADLKDFTDQFRGAVEGNATFHCDRAAEAIHAEQEDDGFHSRGARDESTIDHRSIWSRS